MTLGIQTLETGVFGGVVIGLVTCALHHRFNKIALPQFTGFFGGSRFVPIISSLAAILVGALMTVVWPHFQKLIFGLGGLVDATGYLGTLLYGFILRMLGPFGLHHIFYLPFWTTALGGSEIVNGHWLRARSGSSSPSSPTRTRSISMRARRASCPGALLP